MQQGKIDLVGAVGLRRMDVWLDAGCVVEQDIEDIVTLMVVGADDLRIDGDMIGHHAVGDAPFFEAEILR